MSHTNRLLDTPLEDAGFPTGTGTYALALYLTAPATINIARFGAAMFPAGWMIYVGSAFGSGGLRARVGRHLRRSAQPHWHIDWLLPHVCVVGYWCSSSPVRLECEWSAALLNLRDTFIPLKKFGASDCHAGCAAHLIAFGSTSPLRPITRELTRVTRIHAAVMSYHQLTASPTRD